MALPMILALTICPALLGTQEAIRQSQAKNKREEHRARRCNLTVSCIKPSLRRRDIDGRPVVLRDSKLYIAGEAAPGDEHADSARSGHPFTGYFLPYPDRQYEGLVSTISDDPPMLNWVYVDKNTNEVKYGVRAEAQGHITGPFDCTRQDRRMTLQGWEGFVAVEEFPGTWALYFDRDDDGLVGKVPMGTRVLEVELTRREKRETKASDDGPSQPHAGDAKQQGNEADTEGPHHEGEHKPSTTGGNPEQQEDVVERGHEFDASLSSTQRHLDEDAPYSPSAVSDNRSFSFSAPGKKGSDVDDMTVASSLPDMDDAAVECLPGRKGGTAYKAPYVEDEREKAQTCLRT